MSQISNESYRNNVGSNSRRLNSSFNQDGNGSSGGANMRNIAKLENRLYEILKLLDKKIILAPK